MLSLQEHLKKSQIDPKGVECSLVSGNVTFYKRVQEIKKKIYEMNGVKTESEQCVKDLGVTIASNPKFFQHFRDASGKANRECWVL